MYFPLLAFLLFPACDRDGDGFAVCPGGRECAGDDCDDEDATIYPGASESCSMVDHDCNGIAGIKEDGMDCDTDGVELPYDGNDLNSCIGEDGVNFCGGE